MGALLGGGSGSAAATIAEQERKAKIQEANQAKELAARRRASASGNQSKTLFSQVLGTDESLGKATKLGE